MVGPLPSKFIQDMLGARADIMRAIGVENCDRGPEAAAGSGSNNAGTSGGAAISGGPAGHASAAGSKPAAERQPGSAAPTIEALSEAVAGISKRRRPEGDAAGTARLGHHRRAAASLLEQPGEQLQDMDSSVGATEAALGVAAAQQQGGQSGSAAGSERPLLEAGGSSSCTQPVPAAQQAAPQREAPACSAYSDGSTPFGTPMHIVPSRLVGVLGSAPALGGSGEAAEGAEHDQQQEGVAAAGVDAAAIAAEQRRLEEGDDSAFDPPVLFELE